MDPDAADVASKVPNLLKVRHDICGKGRFE
jgi:hypothetical protein